MNCFLEENTFTFAKYFHFAIFVFIFMFLFQLFSCHINHSLQPSKNISIETTSSKTVSSSASNKELIVIFEVELKGIKPKPIQEGALTDGITAEFAKAGNYNVIDRGTIYYYFKQIQEKSHKSCGEPECLADLAAQLDANSYIMSEVSKSEDKSSVNDCIFSAKLYKSKPNTLIYFVEKSEMESCVCTAQELERTSHLLGKKLSGNLEDRTEPSVPFIGEEIFFPNAKGGPMVYVPAGNFLMGSNNGDDDEKPLHKVYLDAYYIDKYETTVDEYARCINDGKCGITNDLNAGGFEYCNWSKSGMGNHPMNCLNWYDSKKYCEWAGKRLPTEAEWEKAAKGTDQRIYPWGGSAVTCEYAVIDEKGGEWGCGSNSTRSVGSLPMGASPYGAMDIIGNVWEWVSDWYNGKYYQKSFSRHPKGPHEGKFRVLRGGSWVNNPKLYLRVTYRHKENPNNRFSNIGVRCAKYIK